MSDIYLKALESTTINILTEIKYFFIAWFKFLWSFMPYNIFIILAFKKINILDKIFEIDSIVLMKLNPVLSRKYIHNVFLLRRFNTSL